MPPIVSVVMPTRNERWTQQTIDDLLAHATGEIEVIVALEGWWPDPPLRPDPRVIVLHSGQPRGMRGAIEAAAEIARGTYLMKIDAHCLVGPGFDTILAADCDKDWVVVPRRYSLNVDLWAIEPTKANQFIDAHYLCYPYKADRPDVGLHGEVWMERTRKRQDILIDDEMSSQGSCWFMHREHFWKRLGGMPLEGYGRFVQEFQQIGMKTWMGGGRCVVNKKTFYAHLHKGKRFGRGYYISKPEMIDGAAWSADYWLNDRYPKQVATFKWLMEKFWPVPTWGPDLDAALKAVHEKRPLTV